jgi:hypothetical protein
MRLWRALESIYGWAGVRSVWREHMGEDLQFIEPLLTPMEELALSVPWPGAVEGRKVVVHDEDDIVAVDRETSDASPISRDDIVLWKLDADTLFRGVGSALGLIGTPSSVGMGNRLWWLGEYVPVEGERFPVYLATTRDAQTLLRSAGHVSALSQRPFVLVTPSRRAASDMLNRVIEGRGSAWITLEETMNWEGEGVFVAKRPLQELLGSFIGMHVKTDSRHDERARFPTPAGATWGDVTIRFLDGHTVHVNVAGTVEECDCMRLGMASQRNRQPTKQWHLLTRFAASGGVISWKKGNADRSLQKQKELLVQRLQTFFRIEGEPIALVGKDWHCRFRAIAGE